VEWGRVCSHRGQCRQNGSGMGAVTGQGGEENFTLCRLYNRSIAYTTTQTNSEVMHLLQAVLVLHRFV